MKTYHPYSAQPLATRCDRLLPYFLRMFAVLMFGLIIASPPFGIASEIIDKCLAREGERPIINAESSASYRRYLFVTPDEVARYVFLTNRWGDGDSSAAIYQISSKKGSLPGDYWVTATVAADSVRGRHRNVKVRRYDAPLPAAAADAVHNLWLSVLERSRTVEGAIPCAPTGVFSVQSADGARLTGVTVWLDENSFCLALLNLGDSLIEYAKMPSSKRLDAANRIQEDCDRLLKRVESSM